MSSRIQSSNLARLVVRAFFDDIHAVVLESVIRKDVSGIKTSELAEGLKLDNSSVQTALKDLRRNGIIVDRSKKEAVTQRGQSGHVVIWYFDPYRFVQNLKYKNMKFYKEFEKHAQRGDEEEFYVCNNDVCFAKGRRFNVLDAVSYAQKLAESEDFSFTLRCESCNQVLTPEHSGREHLTSKQTMKARANEQIQPIFEKLWRVEELMNKDHANEEKLNIAKADSGKRDGSSGSRLINMDKLIVKMQNHESKKRSFAQTDPLSSCLSKSSEQANKSEPEKQVPWLVKRKKKNEDRQKHQLSDLEMDQLRKDTKMRNIERLSEISDNSSKHKNPPISQAEYDSLVRKLELTTQKSNTPKMTHGSVEIPFGSGGMNGQEVVLVNGAPKLLSEIEQFDIDSMTEEEYLSYTKTIEADIEQTDSFSFL